MARTDGIGMGLIFNFYFNFYNISNFLHFLTFDFSTTGLPISGRGRSSLPHLFASH